MLFQTSEFLILMLAIVIGLSTMRSTRQQHVLLLIASYIFYGWWDVRFLMLIVLSTSIDYASALGMAGIKLSNRQRLMMSGTMLISTALFLVPDWPQIQKVGFDSGFFSLMSPSWPNAWPAIGTMAMFALLAPAMYGWLFRLEASHRRKVFLLISISANLGLLGFFKYFGFFTETLVGLADLFGADLSLTTLQIALPVGISFYTFQTMSYTIDAARGKIAPERSFVRMALYVAYFPQLVAGPILRPQQFFPALDRPWSMRAKSIQGGFHLVLVGLFKKVLIADSVAPLVDLIFTAPQGLPSSAVLLGTVLFAIQIYCDFSGYTDIARGISRMFGVEIPLNFNFPYFSTSIIDFWRRWHISLSSWLRDYLYISLGGNRVGVGRMYINLMVTMMLGGLWHGASWNFVIWGAYQGGLLCINRLINGWCSNHQSLTRWLDSRIGAVLRWMFTMYLWLFGWLIFRVTNLSDLLYCMKQFVLFDFNLSLSSLGLGRADPAIALLAAAAFWALHAWGFFVKRWPTWLDDLPGWARTASYVLLGFLFYFAWPSAKQAFIYFQF